MATKHPETKQFVLDLNWLDLFLDTSCVSVIEVLGKLQILPPWQLWSHERLRLSGQNNGLACFNENEEERKSKHPILVPKQEKANNLQGQPWRRQAAALHQPGEPLLQQPPHDRQRRGRQVGRRGRGPSRGVWGGVRRRRWGGCGGAAPRTWRTGWIGGERTWPPWSVHARSRVAVGTSHVGITDGPLYSGEGCYRWDLDWVGYVFY